jgi:hypothetical protein
MLRLRLNIVHSRERQYFACSIEICRISWPTATLVLSSFSFKACTSFPVRLRFSNSANRVSISRIVSRRFSFSSVPAATYTNNKHQTKSHLCNQFVVKRWGGHSISYQCKYTCSRNQPYSDCSSATRPDSLSSDNSQSILPVSACLLFSCTVACCHDRR